MRWEGNGVYISPKNHNYTTCKTEYTDHILSHIYIYIYSYIGRWD